MEFSKDVLVDLVKNGSCTDAKNDYFEVVHTEQIDTRRWESVHQMVFSYNGKLYSSTYRQGLTEYQDTELYEYDGDMIECPEVEAYPVEITKYRPVTV